MVLFDIGTGYKMVNEWKNDLWNAAHVGIPSHDSESSDAVVFGALVAWFLGEVIITVLLLRSWDRSLDARLMTKSLTNRAGIFKFFVLSSSTVHLNFNLLKFRLRLET